MDFDFSPEQKEIQHQARRMLVECCDLRAVRRVLDESRGWDPALWQQVAELGWLGAAIPEAYGGLGLGGDTLAVIAEELGRALAPLPVSSSIYLAAPCVLHAGSEVQRSEWLPELASGEHIATLAAAEGLVGVDELARHAARVRGGRLSGIKLPVPDGLLAHWAVVTAHDEAGVPGLYRVDLGGPGVTRTALESLDPTRPVARIVFDAAPAQRLGGDADPAPDAHAVLQRVLDEAAVWIAFEQVGAADAALAMSVDYARLRHAFGRPIGSFQGIKHKLADMYVRNQLARANACCGAWALTAGSAELPLAAASARISASEAAEFAAKETIQTHGGIGATWEADPHLFYRRARVLQGVIGGPAVWRERLVEALQAGVQ
ncbi:acyl-CoA/acyl-ACP dehydrogenase [Aquincola sp. S2]|uniref:Acyl-CoA/acyl-ACP dehydrogenase n=1 Tax=Pseudaquabacterium terrae TaxID=2732868 RepID=A0ABX2EBG9_9BURK|nr:acyl-CoA dehydrogenase family protein [Aquabacterium terrae]NRF65876.1 acyl-CoA/acyl-ACP dehydrogenase [Aquabacterium terrae]